MVDVRMTHFLPATLLLLTACSRHFPSHEEVREVVASCGFVIETVEDGYGFDFGGVTARVKRVPEEEFSQKMNCIRWKFFFNRIDRSYVNIDNGAPPIPKIYDLS
jgi:hypothetical protein